MKNITTKKIEKIRKYEYSGMVYNCELKSERPVEQDDLFWVCNGVFVHNCFIKDLNALMSLMKQLNVDPKVMNGAWEKNLEVRPEKDWERLVGRAVSKKEK